MMGLESAACHAWNSEEDNIFYFDLHNNDDSIRYLNASLRHDWKKRGSGYQWSFAWFSPTSPVVCPSPLRLPFRKLV
ncbi:hypothetical protein RND81_06G160900 [Saponaria officinalis]|uniref:Uncharacterized protein n=1 Tax=Saponaria officinalis TaxID=3572 RepID=A0AAW1KBB6_SAPOF